MELNINLLFDKTVELNNMHLVKLNESFLKYFYLMMPKKTCNCPNKPRVRKQEDFDEAYKVYLKFNETLDKVFIDILKQRLETKELVFKDLDGKTIFVL